MELTAPYASNINALVMEKLNSFPSSEVRSSAQKREREVQPAANIPDLSNVPIPKTSVKILTLVAPTPAAPKATAL